jgi:flagellin
MEDFVMGLRIRTNVESIAAQRSLSNNQSELSSSMERLSSGYRVNRSADDAAGLAISESLRAKTRGLNQAKRNANDGISLVQVAEAGLGEISNIMVRLRELTVQASSDTLGSNERSFLQKEYDQLTQEVDRIVKGSEFNGRQLFGEEMAAGLDVQVGYTSDSDISSIRLQFSDGAKLDSEGFELNQISISEGTGSEISKNLDKIDNAIDVLSRNRATLGATQSRLTAAISGINISTENMMASNSRIRDVDFAEETARMTQSRILSQAGISVLTQANAKPEMALALLR